MASYYRIKFFGGGTKQVEKDFAEWMDSDSSIKVVKIHRPVIAASRIYVMVEHTFEKNQMGGF